ncbi:MAG: ABC transporter transmembrane domain-containing protein [Pseudomonadota bacterium]
MDKSIFSFIWRHSKGEQLVLLALTFVSFPFLYLSLELPKQIINDALDGGPGPRMLFGIETTQTGLLALLCAGFLAAVLAQGLMKMWINTRKGVLAERLLRRFRYQLIHRIMRFPQPHFQRVSQGELVSMVTAEAEPMGGLMGDLVAQPVFQGGMMATILAFLFIQNPLLGLAAIALIPLQAWLIPLLQRQINLLNKDRVREVRKLAEEIGESAAGAAELRVNGGLRRRLALVSDRLGRLYEIRFRIYKKKFFMKFLNNFITQLTPFLFFSIGGWLVIQGELTIGALVAGLAAYKDIAGPWKELLAWYNQTQDMSLRWKIVTERFAPKDLLDEKLFEGTPAEVPHIAGPIDLEEVTVRDADGAVVLEGLNLSIPPGSTVAVASRSAVERRAFCQLLTREVLPSSGRVSIAGHPLSELHQTVIGARIGHAGPRPYMFAGSVGDNITMALRDRPVSDAEEDPAARLHRKREAKRSGNSSDAHGAEWLNPAVAGLEDREAMAAWWMQLIEAMGTDLYLFNRGLDARFSEAEHPELARRLVELRPAIQQKLQQKGLSKALHRFDPSVFNPGLPVAGNLLYATPARDIPQEELAEYPAFHKAMAELDLQAKMLKLGKLVIASLDRIFGSIGTEHPLFRKLAIDAALFRRLCMIEAKAREDGDSALSLFERGMLMTVPFRFTAEQIGEAFPPELKARIMELRASRQEAMLAMAGDFFVPIAEDRFLGALTVLENAIFGKVARGAGAKEQKLRDAVSEVLIEAGHKRLVAELIYDASVGLGGRELSDLAQERMAFVRAAIKKPDILLLDRALMSHDRDQRLAMRTRLRALLPETTIVYLEEDFRNRDSFDVFVELEDGRIMADGSMARGEADGAGADLAKKLRKLEKTEMFRGIERRQLRLLAYGSQWVRAGKGEFLFHGGEQPDAAYLLVEGQAELRWPNSEPGDRPASVVEPGRIVGDLSILQGEPRRFDMVATEDVLALRLGGQELMTVVENDIGVAMTLLRTVSTYLGEVGGRLRDARRGQFEDTPIPAK